MYTILNDHRLTLALYPTCCKLCYATKCSDINKDIGPLYLFGRSYSVFKRFLVCVLLYLHYKSNADVGSGGKFTVSP